MQTNEVARSSFLSYGLSHAAAHPDALDLDQHPTGSGNIAMVDIGTSAGLNLCLDHYRVDYRLGDSADVMSTGPADSPVMIHCQATDDFVESRPATISGRFGLDQNPIDLGDRDDARWLLACVWPDQPERFHLLEAAIDIAIDIGVRIDRTLIAGDAVDDLAAIIDQARPTGVPVVTNSWLLNYLDPARRLAFVNELDRIGAHAPLAWVWAESPAFCPDLPWPEWIRALSEDHLQVQATQLMLSTWSDGQRHDQHLATCHPHGRRLTPAEAFRRPPT